MLLRRAPETLEGVLQPLGQGGEALAARHGMGVRVAGPGHPEVIKQVVERLSGNGDAQPAHVGEVGQAHPARLVALPEDHLLVGAIPGLPIAYPPLQGAANVGIQFGMAAKKVVEDRHWADLRGGPKDGRNLRIENVGERVRTPAAAGSLLLGGRPWVGLLPVARRSAEARLGSGHGNGIFLSVHLEMPRLLIGDMAARHERFSFGEKTAFHTKPATACRPPQAGETSVWGLSGRAPPSLQAPKRSFPS